VATMLTVGRRCSRRRLGVGGGAASVSVSVFTAASAPVRLLASPSSLSSDAPARRGARSSPAPPLLPLLSSSSPLSAARALERGKTPKRVGGMRLRPRGSL
jgi:hypothetical protein